MSATFSSLSLSRFHDSCEICWIHQKIRMKCTESQAYHVIKLSSGRISVIFHPRSLSSLLRCPGTAIYTISTGASAEGRRFCSILPAIDTKWYKNQPSWKSGIMSLMAHSTLDSWLLYAWAKRPVAKNEVPSGGMIPPPPAGQPPAPPPPPSDVVGHLRKTYTLED